MAKRIVEGIEVETGTSNVFADLGLPDAEKLKIGGLSHPSAILS